MASASRVVPAVTLVVLVALLVVGSVVGWRSLTAPLPSDSDESPAAAESPCAEVSAGQTVRAGDVVVSVFNAGTRRGLADQVRSGLVERGFGEGEIGNAPGTVGAVARVAVFSAAADDPGARLVARQFGADVQVQVGTEDLGPGVDVVVGDDYERLAPGAPAQITAEAAAQGC